jgi:RNA polymerase sigma factor (sigma-70 family)
MEKYGSRSDRELIAGCLNGDEHAWAGLIARYKRLIYSIPFKYRLSADDAADIFQTVCTILLENLHTLKDQSKISAWLTTTTARECWKLLRERRNEATYRNPGSLEKPPSNPIDPSAPPEELLCELEEQHLVRRALQMLDERCQQLLHYIFYERDTVSYHDIAKALHMPESSIGPTRGRCLAKLKKILTKLGRHRE